MRALIAREIPADDAVIIEYGGDCEAVPGVRRNLRPHRAGAPSSWSSASWPASSSPSCDPFIILFTIPLSFIGGGLDLRADRGHLQHPDRRRPAGPGGRHREQRHRPGGLHQPAAQAGPATSSEAVHRRRGQPPAAHPDDHPDHGAGPPAPGLLSRRRARSSWRPSARPSWEVSPSVPS
ncbi:MAG: hypothetical protein MZV70_69575 [Desulfobacterales bacterium]|nr:hypothetical protein [Desulfobacterales bacterium]